MSRIALLLAKIAWLPALLASAWRVAKYLLAHQNEIGCLRDEIQALYARVLAARQSRSPGGDVITLEEFREILQQMDGLCVALIRLIRGVAPDGS